MLINNIHEFVVSKFCNKVFLCYMFLSILNGCYTTRLLPADNLDSAENNLMAIEVNLSSGGSIPIDPPSDMIVTDGELVIQINEDSIFRIPINEVESLEMLDLLEGKTVLLVVSPIVVPVLVYLTVLGGFILLFTLFGSGLG